ncbi:MAG: integration host factor subunit beta [Planctomycetes bacterium]|nr:integration host factor subunit beta [Planctomycetota bacterium]
MVATVSKKEIVKTVSERHGLTTTQTAQLVQVFMNQIIDELSRGNRIEFREFGIFELKRRKPRIARNPKTGAQVQVPEKTVVSFKPGKVMKARVADTIPADGKNPDEGPAPSRPAATSTTASTTSQSPKPFTPAAAPPPPPPPPAPATSPPPSPPPRPFFTS